MGPRGKTHRYETTVSWTGDLGSGTSSYRAYSRSHEISAAGKPGIPGSSDPAFRGDAARWNPEELLVAALARALHEKAHRVCFIASSVRFPVTCEPAIEVSPRAKEPA